VNPEVQKKGSWCKLGIYSSAESETFIQASFRVESRKKEKEKKRNKKKHLPMSLLFTTNI